MLAFVLLTLPALIIAQSFDFDAINAAPAPIVQTAPIGGSGDSPQIQPYSAIPQIAANAINSSPVGKRGIVTRDDTCASQGNGTGPAVNNPDTPDAFVNYPAFTVAALGSPTPSGYILNFTDLQASTTQSAYLGYTTVDSYDTNQCASLCNGVTGCNAFNLYYERDPSVDPDAQACPNPPSITNIKCVFWGSPVSQATATNSGQYRASFQVVIAGSNGYNKLPALPSIPGFTPGTSFGGQLNVTADPTNGFNSHIGVKFFAYGNASSDVQPQYFSNDICAHACADQTTYNVANPPANGNPAVCNQVVGHGLSKNGQPQGIYCAFYSESWNSSYATVNYVNSGSDIWTVDNVYSYINSTYAASYDDISPDGYQGGNCGGWGEGTC